MDQTPQLCPSCGKPVPPDAPAGLCPGCLIVSGLTRDEGFAETKSGSESTLHIVIPEGTPFPQGAPKRLGSYELIEVIAQGGMGVVYKARHTGLDRVVAVKMIRSGILASPSDVERFHREARSAAKLHHPNIVTIHDIGEQNGQHYFSMDYVPGENLADRARQAPFSPAQAAEITAGVAAAIHYAHQHGVLHRDIKPANVILTPEQHPRVLDFGLALVLADDSKLTLSGTPMGSPPYMSPEQAAGRTRDIDARSDVYSLGALLYELLTGRPPFQAASTLETLRLVLTNEAVSPRRLNPALPRDLETICLKCLQKDPGLRYRTAQELEDELRRFTRDEPILARPVIPVEKVWRWCRRKPLVASLGGTTLVLLMSLAIGSPIALYRIDQQRQRAELAKREIRRRAFALDMNIAKKALDENNLGHAMDVLDHQLPQQGEEDLRGWEWRYLWSLTRSDASFTLCQERNEIHSLSTSSNGNLVVVTVHGRGGLSLWSVRERQCVLRLARDEQNVCAVISPDLPVLAFTGVRFDASGQQRSSLRLWNLVTGKFITEERTLDGECAWLAFSKDGRSLITVTLGNRATYQFGGHIRLWSLPAGTERRSHPLPGLPRGFAVTPDFRQAAVSSDELRLINLEDGRELWRNDFRAGVLAFSPDGRLLAGDAGADIILWDTVTGKKVCQLAGHRSEVRSLVFWPDGKKLASASADQTIRIWDIASQACLDTLRGHRQQVWELSLMPDRHTLVSGCRDGSVCLWDTSVTHPRPRCIEIPDKALAWAFESDSKSVVTMNELGRVTRYKGVNFEIAEPLLETGKAPPNYSCCFSADGRRLARGSPKAGLEVWDTPSRTLKLRMPNTIGQARRMFAGGNRLLLWSLEDFVIHDLDVSTGTEVQSWRAPSDIIHFAISPDERYCVTLGYNGDVVIRDLLKKTSTNPNLDIRESHDGTYSPDGQLLAVPSSLGFVRIWDTRTWKVTTTLRGFFGDVFGSVFLPNGRRLAAVSADGEAIRLYDTATWLDTLTLEADGGILWPTTVSPDGNVIGATTYGGWRLRLWRAPSWEEINHPVQTEGQARRARFLLARPRPN